MVDEGGRWLWEAIVVDHETVAIKQLELGSSGATHRYWWRHLEDDAGGLTDQALDLTDSGFTPVSRSTFYALRDSSIDE